MGADKRLFEGIEADEERASQADRLVALALAAGVRCIRDRQDEAFARVPREDGPTAIYSINSKAFRSWLGHIMYAADKKTPKAPAIADARNTLEGRALHDAASEVVDVALRVAEDAGKIVLDLGDARWRGVRISGDGWRVEAHGATTFRRAATSLSLPEPTRGGDLRRLRQYIRCDDETWPLLAAWLVAALRPRGPYPILLLTGEQGASKTTTARMLRALVDPSILTVRSEPRDARDLMIAAKHSYVVALDNLSRVSSDVADALCCLSTGGGFAARALYSDSDEAAVAVSRPVILTAIEDIATRGDLLDRALIVRLRAIPESERRAEDELWADFEAARPALVGALCDAVSIALRRLDTVRSEQHELTRMADFHLWSLAAEPAFSGTVSFDEAYRAAREASHHLAIEDSLLASPLREFIKSAELAGGARTWSGTATELLALLGERTSDETRRRKDWPKSARGFSGALRRIAPNLRAVGLEIDLDVRAGHTRARTIRIALVPDFQSPCTNRPHRPQRRKTLMA